MTIFIALLRGINVGGTRKVPMEDLRALCGEAGFADVRSYIQSGNLLFSSSGKAAAVEQKLESAIEARFGFFVAVVVRDRDQWARYATTSPLPDANPKLLHLGLTKHPPLPDAVARLRERAIHGERVVQSGDAIWIDYRDGVAQSKLTPAFIDKAVGSTLTARNWNSVQKLHELALG
jgi:uncharacterized protein (DUF1697 family)